MVCRRHSSSSTISSKYLKLQYGVHISDIGPDSCLDMSKNNLVAVSPTSNAPNSIPDLEALLKNDIKVKVAGEFHTDITSTLFSHFERHRRWAFFFLR